MRFQLALQGWSPILCSSRWKGACEGRDDWLCRWQKQELGSICAEFLALTCFGSFLSAIRLADVRHQHSRCRAAQLQAWATQNRIRNNSVRSALHLAQPTARCENRKEPQKAHQNERANGGADTGAAESSPGLRTKKMAATIGCYCRRGSMGFARR